MPMSTRFAAFLLLPLLLVACGDDDDPAAPARVGTASNPQSVDVGTPVGGDLADDGSYFVTFRTSTAGDYEISLVADQPVAWTLRPGDTSLGRDSHGEPVESCGGTAGAVDATCIGTGLDAGSDYVVELENRGVAVAAFTLTVTKGMGVGSINDPVAWVGTYNSCVDEESGQVGTRSSFYSITDMTPDLTRGIYAITSLTDFADFYVYSDPGFTVLVASAMPQNSSFGLPSIPITTGGTVYLRVDGSRTEDGATFRFVCD